MSTEVEVTRIPGCQFRCDKPAEYDFKTRGGPWAYGCQTHYIQMRHFLSLGTGKGQKLVKV